MATSWVDLLDPDEAALRGAWSGHIHPGAMEAILRASDPDDLPRPKIEGHRSYIFFQLLVPKVGADEEVVYQECDVLLDERRIVTIRKTPRGAEPFQLPDLAALRAQHDLPAGMVAYHVVDDVAESFLNLIDDLNDEVDEMEDHVDDWSNDTIRRRLSDLRHDLLHIRRTLSPTRDAVRSVVDNRVDLDAEEVFPHEVELRFGDAFDKLLRASEGLETARDLIGGVRDYHQSKVANDQNEVMKVLTVVAAIFLPPTFVVGLYGQNFVHMPELGWAQGYGFSWLVILASTVTQLVFFRRKGWI